MTDDSDGSAVLNRANFSTFAAEGIALTGQRGASPVVWGPGQAIPAIPRPVEDRPFDKNKQPLTSYAQFLKEYLVAHGSVGEHFVPAEHLNIKPDVAVPLEPAKTIRHLGEVLVVVKPLLDFGRHVADDVPVEWGVLAHTNSAAIWKFAFASPNLVDVAFDLLDGIVLR